MNSTNRIITNTVASYAALIIKMFIGIFSVRYILQALGETDYGVYIAVAGVAALLDMLNGSMTSTSMRNLAYELGKNNPAGMKRLFNTTLCVHYLVGIFTVVVMEVFGSLLLEYVLNIPVDKMVDARIIFQMMIITTFISVIAVPYDAVMNAHEHLWMLSIFDITGAILTLGMALFLMHAPGDRLLWYGGMLLLIQIILRLFKLIYSKRNFSECRNVSIFKSKIEDIKPMLSFTGWTLFGNLAAAFSTHLRGILLNVFFGVKLNASEGISRQVNNYVNMFAVSLTKAINPQMIKSEGGGNRDRMLRVTVIASKYSSYLFALIGIPFMFEAPFIFKLWLGEVPEYAVIFSQLSMITILVTKYTTQIGHSIYAVGNIKLYQFAESVVAFLPLLISYIVLKSGGTAISVYWVYLISQVFVIAERFYLGKQIAGININKFVKEAILSTLIPVLFASCLVYLYMSFFAESVIRVIGTFVIFFVFFTSFFFIIGIDETERNAWKRLISSFLKK